LIFKFIFAWEGRTELEHSIDHRLKSENIGETEGSGAIGPEYSYIDFKCENLKQAKDIIQKTVEKHFGGVAWEIQEL